MSDMYRLGILIIIVSTWAVIAGADGRTKCKFPAEWKGRWYQSGLGEVSIRTNTIVQKGTCVENHRDYFLVEHRRNDCYQCLLMLPRHENIIQYKESYCMAKDTLRKICHTIQPEAPLYTLVREPFLPSRCPFQDAYYFDYNDLMSGFCQNGLSYVKPCAGNSKFQFHFQHCVEYAMLNGQDFDFDCIGTWKDGSDMYLYGKFHGGSVRSKDDSYRCFKYMAYGSELYMSMSADATCLGLRSYRDGPVVMEFNKDENGWPQPKCDFPDEFAGTTWRDLAGRHIYEIDGRERGRVLVYSIKRRSDRIELKSEYRCVNIVSKNMTSRTTVILSYTSHGCSAKHQCLMVKEIHPNLMEIRLGRILGQDAEAHHCSTREADYDDVHILISESISGTPCPYPGRYHLTPTATGCNGEFVSGCNQTHQMDLDCGTKGQDKSTPLTCLVTWRAPNRTHVVARRMNFPDESPNCFIFTEMANELIFETDNHCNHNVPKIFSQPLSLRLSKSQEECATPDVVDEQDLAIETDSDYIYMEGEDSLIVGKGEDGDKEGFYQHMDKQRPKPNTNTYSTPSGPTSGCLTLHTESWALLNLSIALLIISWSAR